LGDPLQDTLVAQLHGGDVCTGEVEVAAKHEVFLTEKANVSITARPYAINVIRIGTALPAPADVTHRDHGLGTVT